MDSCRDARFQYIGFPSDSSAGKAQRQPVASFCHVVEGGYAESGLQFVQGIVAQRYRDHLRFPRQHIEIVVREGLSSALQSEGYVTGKVSGGQGYQRIAFFLGKVHVVFKRQQYCFPFAAGQYRDCVDQLHILGQPCVQIQVATIFVGDVEFGYRSDMLSSLSVQRRMTLTGFAVGISDVELHIHVFVDQRIDYQKYAICYWKK